MAKLNQPIKPDYTPSIVAEALAAMLDAEERTITLRNGTVLHGWVWELYRSITTQSVRFRCSDIGGTVYHFNTLHVERIERVL